MRLSARRRVSRGLAVLVALAVAGVAAATPALATPWGTTGADYTGVLCRLPSGTVPLGAWTVNSSDRAYALSDIAGAGPVFQPAPTTGATGAMVAGQGGFSGADIAAVAYLIAQHGDGSPAELAELSADVAAVAGGGGLQAQCLGQGGTSAARAASRLDEARRFAGPYTVGVDAPTSAIPGSEATVTVTVRSAAGVGTPGLDVAIAAGGSTATARTGSDGRARARVVVPSAATTPVTATVTAPTGLTLYGTTPASVAAGATSTATGTGTLRPVLHPDPRVSVTAAELLLSGGSLEPTAVVSNTSGYSGTGTVTVSGPVQPAAGRPCSSVPANGLGATRAVWQGTFSFTGDSNRTAGTSPALTPGCYALSATVTTTDSSPAETRKSTFDADRTVTVSTLTLATAATSRVSPAGDLRATITGSNPGRAKVSTTVTARGPRPIGDTGCTGVDFDSAASAATSDAVTATRAGAGLRSTVTVPGVSRVGCYALDARSVVTQDGKTLRTSTPLGATGTTTAVVRPQLTLSAAAPSGEQGTAMRGTVQVVGTFGFPGTVSVGLLRSSSLPITGCRDARFPDATSGTPTRVAVKGDNTYTVRTPVASANACYAVTARLVLADNAAVTASSGAPSDSTVFLAGFRPQTRTRAAVQTGDGDNTLRALIIYGFFALLILGGCVTLFVRTVQDARAEFDGEPLWTWRPNRLPDVISRRPLPGPRPSG